MTASSELTIYTAAASALNGDLAWSTSGTSCEKWIQADLGVIRTIDAVLTQGQGDPSQLVDRTEYVQEYKISVGIDVAAQLSYVLNPTSGSEVFQANSNPSTVKRNYLPANTIASIVRLTIVNYNDWPSLRWELLGC